MNIKLVSYSQPTEEFAELGITDAQELIAFCARVSNPSNQFNTETSEKLINYLIKHKHWSPLEMVNVCLEINTTRDIARQLLRHASFRFQEFSQRYADPTDDLSFEIREARFQDPKNRQNSITVNTTEEEEINNEWKLRQQGLIEAAKVEYAWAISKGIAKEQARVVLPEGNTKSRVYVNGTLRSWIHYIQVRSNVDTQLEHKLVAVACAQAISAVFPMANDFVYQEPVKPKPPEPVVIEEKQALSAFKEEVKWWQHLFNFYKH
jgi:thymidylate synthase (FAD)